MIFTSIDQLRETYGDAKVLSVCNRFEAQKAYRKTRKAKETAILRRAKELGLDKDESDGGDDDDLAVQDAENSQA